jgi:hypothetical protein
MMFLQKIKLKKKGFSKHFVVPYFILLPQGLITTKGEGDFKYKIIMCKIFGGRIGP